MTKRVCFVTLLGLLSVGCASVSKWESRFTEEEKVQIVFDRAMQAFAQGKEQYDHQLLQKAYADFEFLVESYKHRPSQEKLGEINAFYRSATQSLEQSIKEAKESNNFFALVGYYRRLQRLVPKHTEATQFLSQNQLEIQQRIEQSLAAGKQALASKDYAKAASAFSAVLSAVPELQEARDGLASAQTGLAEEARRAEEAAARARRRAATKEKDEKDNPQPLSPEEKERLYQAGKAAFDRKDFLTAYKSFSAIGDENYKDTRIYLQRSASKVKALRLQEK